MSPVFTARRRAEEFQALVEGTSTGRGSDARLDEFLEIVDTLRAEPPVAARPEFVADLREQLLDEARTQARLGKGHEAAARLTVVRSTGTRRRERRLAAAVGGLALVGATAGMSVAAQDAIPGDPLYPLKRAIENAATGVQPDEDAKAKVLLANASGRLDEVDQLSRESDDAEVISATLQTFSDQASEASELLLSDYAENGQEDSVEELRDFTADSLDELTALETLIPEDARASLIQAAQTLTQIDQEALIACPACGPGIVAEIPDFTSLALKSLLGPVTEPLHPGEDPKPAKKEQGPPNDEQQQPPTTTLPTPDTTEGPAKGPDKGDDDGGSGDGGLIDNTLKNVKDKVQKDDDEKGLLEGATDTLANLLGGILK
jgi:hypothetical protein